MFGRKPKELYLVKASMVIRATSGAQAIEILEEALRDHIAATMIQVKTAEAVKDGCTSLIGPV